MNRNEHNYDTVRITDGVGQPATNLRQSSNGAKLERLKKPIIFGLMAIVFVGCLYLTFKPSDKKEVGDHLGLMDAVPQASDAGMQSDKQKAYEEAQLDQAQQQKRNALTSLADYWADDEKEGQTNTAEEMENREPEAFPKPKRPAVQSYLDAQRTLGSFYKEEPTETNELKRQIEELRGQIAQRETQPADNVETQLALMEKSYQMAAKYLPHNGTAPVSEASHSIPVQTAVFSKSQKDFISFSTGKRNVVSSLGSKQQADELAKNGEQNSSQLFLTATGQPDKIQDRNSVRAMVQENQEVSPQSAVRLRLAESARMAGHLVPAGIVLVAVAKFQHNRLHLQVSSIELGGNIFPVSLTIYDMDGQQGLLIPYSTERSALTEMAANMGQQSGSSLMLTQSAGQQIVGDLSRGVVQGVSGYLSKKVRVPKVTIKAGHQVFLVSKK